MNEKEAKILKFLLIITISLFMFISIYFGFKLFINNGSNKMTDEEKDKFAHELIDALNEMNDNYINEQLNK